MLECDICRVKIIYPDANYRKPVPLHTKETSLKLSEWTTINTDLCPECESKLQSLKQEAMYRAEEEFYKSRKKENEAKDDE